MVTDKADAYKKKYQRKNREDVITRINLSGPKSLLALTESGSTKPTTE